MKQSTDLSLLISLAWLKSIVEHIEKTMLVIPGASGIVEFPLCKGDSSNLLMIDRDKKPCQYCGVPDQKITDLNIN